MGVGVGWSVWWGYIVHIGSMIGHPPLRVRMHAIHAAEQAIGFLVVDARGIFARRLRCVNVRMKRES